MEVRPGYKLTEAGVIPIDWDARTLLDLADRKKELFDDGDWVEAKFLTDRGIRLIQTGNIGEGEFTDRHVKKYISAESFKKLRCKDLQVGDILICRLAEPAGRACVLRDIGEDRMITAVDVTIFRPPAAIADRHFLVNIFTTPRWYQTVAERCGGSTRTRISRGELGKISVPMPPLPEQRAIAAALSDVDALLGGLDRLIAKKRDLKQAAMQQLLTGQTRLPGFSGEWEVKPLGDVVETDPEALRSDTKPEFTFKYIALEDVDRGVLRGYSDQRFATAPSRARRKVRYGDVLISTVRPNLQSHLLFRAEGSHWICSTGFCVVRCHANVTHPGYVFYHLFAHPVSRQIEALLTGSNYPAINSGDVRALQIPLPEYGEQAAIAAVLSDMDAEIAALEARRDKTRDLKQAMMQELLTGKTRLVKPEAAHA